MPVHAFGKRLLFIAGMLVWAFSGFSQQKITDLQNKLQNESNAVSKADIAFEIAMGYRSGLKMDSAFYYAEKISEYSKLAGYQLGEGKYQLARGIISYLRSNNEEAKQDLNKAIIIFNEQKDGNLLGQSYQELAQVYYASDDIYQCRMNNWIAAGLLVPLKNYKVLYTAYWSLARTYFKTYDVDSTSFYFSRSLEMAEKVNDPNKIYIASCGVARSFLSLDEAEKAVYYFEYGLKNRKPQTDKIGFRGFVRDYAISLVMTHRFAKADSVLKEIESLNDVLKDGYGTMIVNRIKGTFYHEQNNYPEAEKYLKLANEKMTELKVLNTETKDVLLLLGKTEYETRSYDQAIAHLETAAELSKQFRTVTDEREANLFISRSFQQKQNADSALVYFKSYAALKDSILSQQKQKTIIEVATRYETDKKEQTIKILEKEQQANSFLLDLRNQQIEKQKLENERNSQSLQLLSQQAKIQDLEASQKNLALQNQEIDILKKQKELQALSTENNFRKTIAEKESQQKRMAYIAVLVIFILGTVAFYRYRQSRKLGKKLAASLVSLREAQDQLIATEKEKEAENIRVRISRDIHDEVGATLSGVALFSEIAKQKIEQQKNSDVQVYLDHISTNSKEMVEKMSDIVWAINPENDSFERIIAKLRSYAFNLCAGKGISLQINIAENIQSYHPSMEIKRDLYLLIKEALNNAVKYSGAKSISLSIASNANGMIVEIKDDGKGFDTSLSYMGNGLKNMKARANSLDAKFAMDSQQGRGTKINLQFNFHPFGGQSKAV